MICQISWTCPKCGTELKTTILTGVQLLAECHRCGTRVAHQIRTEVAR